MNWYLKVFNQYFDFSGRARRKEYWIFTFFNLIITSVLTFLDFILETHYFLTFSYIYSMLIFIPSLAVLLRRLHDIGKTGWYILILFIPLIGVIWMLVLLSTESEPGTNKWGENPKGIGYDRLINQIGRE